MNTMLYFAKRADIWTFRTYMDKNYHLIFGYLDRSEIFSTGLR